jgi:hypothetical protein
LRHRRRPAHAIPGDPTCSRPPSRRHLLLLHRFHSREPSIRHAAGRRTLAVQDHVLRVLLRWAVPWPSDATLVLRLSHLQARPSKFPGGRERQRHASRRPRGRNPGSSTLPTPACGLPCLSVYPSICFKNLTHGCLFQVFKGIKMVQYRLYYYYSPTGI